MKSVFSLLIFILVTAFMCFAVMYWGFHSDMSDSIGAAMGAAIGGGAVVVIAPFLKRNQ